MIGRYEEENIMASTELSAKKVAVVATDFFEETELIEPVKALK